MRVIHVIVHRLRSMFMGSRLDDEAREEIAAHLERQIALNRASGMPVDEARRAARVDVGQLPQLGEACRDARGLAWWDALRSDTRYAFRQIRKRPGFSAAAIVTLALGVGATTAVFAVVDAVILRPLPYPASERLYSLYEVNSRANVGRTRVTALNFLDWQQHSQAFSGMAAHAGTGFSLTGQGDPAFVLGQLVTTNLFDVLGVRPAIGRTFMPHEGEAGSHRVAIVTHALWMRHFGGDASVVGRTSSINGELYQIIGVLPPSVAYPTEAYELMVPLVTSGALAGMPPMDRNARYLRVVARLGERATEEGARSEIGVIGGRLAEAYSDTNETVTIGMAQLAADTIGDANADLLVVLIAVAVVLLVACVNVAGLAIARGSARARELAVRAALGASRGRLVRQLATESFLLFALGGLLGVTLAAWGISVFASELPLTIPRVSEIGVDWRFASFSFALTFAAGMLFSVLPALSIARRGPWAGMAGSRGSVSAARSTLRTRGALIVAQIAAAVVLLAGAALAVRSFDRVLRTDTGFDAAQTLTFSFVMQDQAYPSADDLRAFTSRVSETLNATAGIEAAGLTTHLPLSDQNIENGFTVEGSPVEDAGDPPIAGVRGMTGHYRAAIGARLLQGRDLLPGDTALAPLVVVVTEGFVKRHVRSADPIGARLKMGGPDSTDPWRTIVGVIADIRHAALDEAPRPEVWFPYAQIEDGLMTRWLRGTYVAARTSIPPESLAPSMRAALRELDASLPLRNLQPMSELARASTAERRLETYLLAGFAALATVMAAIGLFGVLAFHVAQHAQEFAVRLAIGATPAGLLTLVIRRGVVLLAIGLVLGVPGAIVMGRGMSALLYGVTPADPIALGGAIALLSAVTLLACVVPARRAMRIDPLAILRSD